MRRFRTILTTLLFLSLSVSGAIAEQPSSKIPQEIAARNQARKAPIWVAAETAAKDFDREDLFSPANRTTLRQRLAASSARGEKFRSDTSFSLIAEAACTEFSMAPEIQAHEAKSHGSYEDVVRNANSILAGRVDSVAVGFLDGVPGTLLGIDVAQEVRRSGDLAPGPYVYLYYPYAAFQVNGQVQCTRDADFPHHPKVGEGILVFNFYPPLDAEGNLLYTYAEGIFFEDAAGELIVPKRLRQEAWKLPANNIEGLIQDLLSRP